MVFLFSFAACDMFDDDDDDNDVVDTTDDNLVGTYYRYSRIVDDTTNAFNKSKLVLDGNGTGVEYCELPGEVREERLSRVIDWETDQNNLTITGRLEDSTLFDGEYLLGSGIGFLRLTDENGLEDMYIREMDVQNENILGVWTSISIEIEGLPRSYILEDCEYLPDGTMVWGDTLGTMNWFVNSSYLVWIDQENPDYSQLVWNYNLKTSVDNPDTLLLESNILLRNVEDEAYWASRKFYATCVRKE